MNRSLIKKSVTMSFLTSLLLFFSCNVMLIGAYDQVTDQGIQKIQNEITTIIVKIESNIDNKTIVDNKYDNFKNDYSEIKGEIQSLETRCVAIPKYKLVLDQVKALDNTLNDFEKLHKLGFDKKNEVETIRSTFNIEFQAMITLQNGLKRTKTDKTTK